MAFEVHALNLSRFEDFADVVNPTRRETHCWCLVHRLNHQEMAELAPDRQDAMRALCERPIGPGVVGYADGEPVGWCHIGPRADMPRLVRSSVLAPIDDVPVWSIICTVIRSGRRRRGYTAPLLEGAVAHARAHGAPAVEAYPVDAQGGRVDTTMAFVGTRAMFEAVGFRVVGETAAVASGRPRLVMRRDLAP